MINSLVCSSGNCIAESALNKSSGPLLEANWGDTFEITVENNLFDPAEGTLLHWHGLFQHSTPWYDGVPAVDMCPIAPGRSFKYRFKADVYGTSWWHSHYDAQYVDGLWGPMVIYGSVTLHQYHCTHN
jgi:FtsP/CotA-like multicopper oxidase with cupredoxin domain